MIIKYNKLTVLEIYRKEVNYKSFLKPRKRLFATAICDCGNTRTDICLSDIKSGNTKSCGCLVKESAKTSDKNLIHGLSNTPEYRILNGAKGRCYTKSNKSYPFYGAKGITVCERWRNNGILKFIEDMGLKPSSNHSLDRIDNSKGYYKENCRWVTVLQQASNKSNTLKVLYQGKETPLVELLREHGILDNFEKYRKRLRRGWSIEDILNPKSNFQKATPKRKQDLWVIYQGKDYRFWELLDLLQLRKYYDRLYDGVRKKIPFDQCLADLNRKLNKI